MNIDLSETMLLRVHDPYTISQVSTLLRASAAKRFKCQPIRKNGRKPPDTFIAEWMYVELESGQRLSDQISISISISISINQSCGGGGRGWGMRGWRELPETRNWSYRSRSYYPIPYTPKSTHVFSVGFVGVLGRSKHVV